MPLKPTKRPYIDLEATTKLFGNGGDFTEKKETRRFYLDLVGATPENITNYLAKPGWRILGMGNILDEKGGSRGAEIEGIAKIANIVLNAEARAQQILAAASTDTSIKAKLEKKLSEKTDG
jgi:hypothetical protein